MKTLKLFGIAILVCVALSSSNAQTYVVVNGGGAPYGYYPPVYGMQVYGGPVMTYPPYGVYNRGYAYYNGYNRNPYYGGYGGYRGGYHQGYRHGGGRYGR